MQLRRATPLLLLKILCFAILWGCDSVPIKPASNTADGIYTWAKQFEKEERYIEALEQFNVVKNKYPYSRYALLSELAIADIHYKRESFLEAQNAYQIFKDLHPKHDRIDYVTFRLAMSIFHQLPSTIDRDLSLGKKAILFFDEVVTFYPSSEYAAEATKRMAETQKMLAQKEFYIANYYFTQKQYLSSLRRYQYILKNFAQQESFLPQALLGAARSAHQLGEKETATSYVSVLQQRFPQSKEAQNARKAVK